MTAPENGLGTSPDSGLEEALRQALNTAVSEIAPGDGNGDPFAGLAEIRSRINGRPPRPWLLSVLVAGVERVRYWTWRGHWAWPESLPRLADLPLPRVQLIPRSGAEGGTARTLPQWNIGWLRPAAVLAGIAVIACVSLGVQPFRQAIIQASSTVLHGGSAPQAGNAGTLGDATQATDGTSVIAGHTPGVGSSSRNGASAPQSTASLASPAATAGCTKSGTTSSTASSGGSGGTGAQVPGPLMPSPIPSAAPYYSATAAPTCPSATPSSSPRPTVTSQSPTATPTGTGTGSPTATASTSSSPTPTVSDSGTPTVSSSGTPTGSSSPTDSASSSASPSDTSGGVSGNGSSNPTPTASPTP